MISFIGNKMQFIDLKAQQEKIDDFRFVIASPAKRSIHMVLDTRYGIQSMGLQLTN